VRFMKHCRTASVLFLFFTCIYVPFAAAGTGTSALPFLKMDAGARAAALGGAYAAPGEDAYGVFYNVAGTAFAASKEIVLSHNVWLEETSQENIAYLHPCGRDITLFGGVNMLRSGSMKAYDNEMNRTGSFSDTESAWSVGFSKLLFGNLSAGAALKYYSQYADGENASSFGADLGLLFKSGPWNTGLSFSNLGGKIKYYTESYDLPVIARAGLSRYLLDGRLMLTAEYININDSGSDIAGGAEYSLPLTEKDRLSVRAGYRSGRESDSGSGISVGAGFSGGGITFDYAFVPYGELGNSHRVSLGYAFGSGREINKYDKRYGKISEELMKKRKESIKSEYW